MTPPSGLFAGLPPFESIAIHPCPVHGSGPYLCHCRLEAKLSSVSRRWQGADCGVESHDGLLWCLDQLGQALEALDTEHPGSREKTPPMMWPEWLHCVIQQRVAPFMVRTAQAAGELAGARMEAQEAHRGRLAAEATAAEARAQEQALADIWKADRRRMVEAQDAILTRLLAAVGVVAVNRSDVGDVPAEWCWCPDAYTAHLYSEFDDSWHTPGCQALHWAVQGKTPPERQPDDVSPGGRSDAPTQRPNPVE